MSGPYTNTTNSNETVKHWSDTLYLDTMQDKSLVGKLISDGTIAVQDELSKGKGDRVRVFQLARQTGKGAMGMQSATGRTNSQTYYDNDIYLDQLRYIIEVPAKGTIDDQRVLFDLIGNSYDGARDWFAERIKQGVFRQLCGFTATSFTFDGETYTSSDYKQLTGMQAALAPSTNRKLFMVGSDDQTVQADSTATLRLTAVDQAQTLAKVRSSAAYIQPINPEGVKFKLYVHPKQMDSLIQDTSGPVQYRDMFIASIQSGKSNGELRRAIYRDTEIIETDVIPNGVHSGTGAVQSNVYRALFVGKHAGTMVLGAGYTAMGDTTPGFSFKTDQWDVGNYDRIAAVGVWGFRKNVFNSVDYGSITISSFAA